APLRPAQLLPPGAHPGTRCRVARRPGKATKGLFARWWQRTLRSPLRQWRHTNSMRPAGCRCVVYAYALTMRQAEQTSIQAQGKPFCALAHDLIMVPGEQGFGNRRQQIHPYPGGAYMPFVTHYGCGRFIIKMPTADTFELSACQPFQKLERFGP